MELILLENIINLGNIGDKVEVKPGYGRNFLLKTGRALRFNKENLEYVSKKDELNKKNNELKKKLKDTAQIINKKTLHLTKKVKKMESYTVLSSQKRFLQLFLKNLK